MAFLKSMVGGISIVMVLGLCIGLLVVMNKDYKDDEEKALTTTSKTVAAVCNQTYYKNRCIESVSSVARNESASLIDFIKATLNYTIHHVELTKNHTVHVVGKEVTNATEKLALEDCIDMLQYTVDELLVTFAAVDNSTSDTILDSEAELRNWLSAAVSYQRTCLDGVTNTELFKPMSKNLVNSTRVTSNALAMVSAIPDILHAFHIESNHSTMSNLSTMSNHSTMSNQTSSRRLISFFPKWMSKGDRKLLARRDNVKVEPNAIVALDGSGQYKTIKAALAAYPKNLTGRYVIYVKSGIYNESVAVGKNQTNVFMYGDGPRKTIVTGNKSFKDGIPTIRTASFTAIGDGFMAKSMGFRNTAGPTGKKAVALRVQSDKSAIYNCKIDGYQSTLYQQAHRQFYRNCIISGTIDFIFGDATAFIQSSMIIVRKPDHGQKNIITAQLRVDKHESTGLVIQNCQIVPEKRLFPVAKQFPTFLGRTKKPYARTVIMESEIGGFIEPSGWLETSCRIYPDTVFFAEYRNRGIGANTSHRVKWKGYHVFTNRSEIRGFRAARFIQGNKWLRSTGFPYYLGIKSG